ncbi:MAG: acetylxylan esterase [Bacteroidaceae bacterium]|nr:acetylxylan esterase [Bacteroidaceae bacterium]
MKTKFILCAFCLLTTWAVAQDKYFTAPTDQPVTADAEGFVRRWTLLEPISKPNRTNTVFTDSYLREVFATEYFPGQMTLLPRDGQKVKARFEKVEMPKDYRRIDPATLKVQRGTETLRWHKLDSKTYNLKLMRFGEHYRQRLYGVIYWVVTVVRCEEDMTGVRLSVGSNSASQWWVNGTEALLLSGDRRMVADDAMSARLVLHKGDNVIRGAIINGPGMSDFCLRFVREDGTPVTQGFTIL